MPTKCFWLEPLNIVKRYRRAYETGPCPLMGGQYGYHNEMFFMDEEPLKKDENGYCCNSMDQDLGDLSLYPTQCKCGYKFTDKKNLQIFVEPMYTCKETGLITSLDDAPPGAMWDAWWMTHGNPKSPWAGPDGKCIIVVLPNRRQWVIDSRASNCTMPNDNEHKCWVRHGTPPNLTVDKNGKTCGAGGGSILAGDYHGFLQNGYLTP